jgi:hypothetical protein
MDHQPAPLAIGACRRGSARPAARAPRRARTEHPLVLLLMNAHSTAILNSVACTTYHRTEGLPRQYSFVRVKQLSTPLVDCIAVTHGAVGVRTIRSITKRLRISAPQRDCARKDSLCVRTSAVVPRRCVIPTVHRRVLACVWLQCQISKSHMPPVSQVLAASTQVHAGASRSMARQSTQ